jgi:hypothetical protein
MSYDPIILRRWPEILPTLDELGLEARHGVLDGMGGDRIDIFHAGETDPDLTMGTVRFVEGGWYRGKAIDEEGEVHRGPLHRTILEAFEDVINDIRTNNTGEVRA